MLCKQATNTSQIDMDLEQDQYQNNSLIADDSEQEKSQPTTTITQEFTSFQYLTNQYSSLDKVIDQQKLQQPKSQGCFVQYDSRVPIINEAKLETFKEFIEELKTKDFTYLSSVWGKEFLQKINFILDHWPTYKLQYATYFKDFLNIINSKIQTVQIYEEFYPQMSALITKLSQKIEERGNKGLVKCHQLKEDFLFSNYIKEQQAKSKKAGSFYLKQENDERQLLGSYIVENKYFNKNIETWKLFFFIGYAVKRYKIDALSDQDFKNQCRKIYRFAQLLLQNNQLTQPAKRLCCSKFFYMNFNIAPLANTNLICRLMNDSLRNKVERMYNKKVEDKVQADQFQNYMKELMLDTCSLLNHGGGVILLYAKRMYLEAWVQGETILQDKKDFYFKLIEKGLQAIKPNIKLQKQIFISFVPVAKNPYEYGYLTEVEDEKDRAVNRNYIQGLFVPRINIVPTQSEKLYCYQVANQQPVSAIYKNHERIQIRGQDLLLFKKQREQYFRIEEEDEQTRDLLGKDYLYVDRHICPQPYKGHPMFIQQERVVSAKPDKQFKYMSMLIAHKSNHLDIQRKLISKGIDCMISGTFYNLKLKSSMSSAPLYHNVRFDQILNEVGYNKQYEYNGRYILVVAVSTYIKIVGKANQTNQSDVVTKANMHTLLDYIQKVFPNNSEVLELFRFTNEEKEVEHYIKSTSREATLLVYYLMHNSGQNCVFKNPKSLDKLPAQEKKKRWQLVYSVSTKQK